MKIEHYLTNVLINSYVSDLIQNIAFNKGVTFMSKEHIDEIIEDWVRRSEKAMRLYERGSDQDVAEARRELRLGCEELRMLKEMIDDLL